MFRFLFCVLISSILFTSNTSLWADGPKDNISDSVRRIPPVGIELEPAIKKELLDGQKKLYARIEKLKFHRDSEIVSLIPDVEIFARAVRDSVLHQELYSKRDITSVKNVLAEGFKRVEALERGEAPWTTKTGLVVRGYRSKIDQTVQPYGLEIPESYSFPGAHHYRLDLWFHGRGERTSEPLFISQRMVRKGRVNPKETIVLHPYGRYSNAFKFAGEIDVLEALEHAKKNYRVDQDRISVRGFSMGGAGCWQMAVHYPDLFFAANPGAGFSETPEFLKFFQKETLNPTWYEKKLWQMYDCTGYAPNLYQLPTVAYSGELDIQKQAADIMGQALAKENMRLTHLIGPKTKHTIHPDSAKIIEAKLARLAKRGRNSVPERIRFVTYSLKYNQVHWVKVTGLSEHWKQASVEAKLLPAQNEIELSLQNVTGIELNLKASQAPFSVDRPVVVTINGKQKITTFPPETDQSWKASFSLQGTEWKLGKVETSGLRKKHNLQGPIDDAFMGAFLVVVPTGEAWNKLVGEWSQAELKHFITHWRQQFRGDAQIVKDTALTQKQIETHHLIFFGDPGSNKALAKIMPELPLRWSRKELVVAKKKYDAANHSPVLIYPNPSNPEKYLVINSGFTYREFAYLNNARQVPKLPDWAVIDLRTPADSLWPGKVVDANFFDENWQLKSE